MGHGWKKSGTRTEEKACKCKKGHVYKKVLEEESDYPPFEREKVIKTWSDCPDKCEESN